MKDLKESIKQSIQQQLKKLEVEEDHLNKRYTGRMNVASDGYYVSQARTTAKNEAFRIQNRLDEIITRKLELLKELQAL